MLPKRAILFCLATSLLFATLLNGSVDAATQVAIHPQASQAPTAEGQTIKALHAHGGRLYTGYGDYGIKAGPTAINSFDGNSFASGPAMVTDSEQISVFRTIDGKIYAPSVDPIDGADLSVGTTGPSGEVTWESRDVVNASHVYDIATLNGKDLYIVGSAGADATVWRSTDEGKTFQTILTVPAVAKGDFARFYGTVVQDGKLFVQAVDYSAVNEVHPSSKVFDGAVWRDGPNLGLFTNSKTFMGKSLLQRGYHAGSKAGVMATFDGTTVETLSSGYFYDYAISENGNLYGLDAAHRVVMTRDLITWTPIGDAPANTRSIGILDGSIYLGGTNGGVYRFTP